MNTEMAQLHARIMKATGQRVGIAVKQGRYQVTATHKQGRAWVTIPLTGWGTLDDSIAAVRRIADRHA